MNKVLVYCESQKYLKSKSSVSRKALKVLKMLKKDNLLVEFFLVSEKEIKKINLKYRKKNKVTNVLSFCETKGFIFPKEKQRRIGEIYLSLDFIKRNNQDLNLMVVHGILHLLGYDHIVKKDREKMERLEDRILRDNKKLLL